MPPVPIQPVTGRFFRFPLPQGWQVQENTNMLCVTAPDQSAALLGLGMAGMMQAVSPDGFLQYAMQMSQYHSIRILGGRPVQPPPGATQAGEFEVQYMSGNVPLQGIALSSVTMGYGQCNAFMILAMSRLDLWPHYRPWLPGLIVHIGPAGSQTFMAGTIAANNQRDAQEFGQRLHEANAHTQNLQQQMYNDRWNSDMRNQFDFRENLGGVQTMTNPYDNNRQVEMPMTYSYYWVSRDGRIVGSNDPGFNPTHGTGEEWQQMPRYRP
jgi:hypothetical protein